MRYQVAKGIDELYIFISGRRQFEKGYIFYKSSYMTFWKVKTMKTVKKKKKSLVAAESQHQAFPG